MLIRKPDDRNGQRFTPESLYLRRRDFLASAAVPVLAGAATLLTGDTARAQGSGQKLDRKKSPLSTDREADAVQRRHHLQQLLRVRHRQGRSGREREESSRPRPWTVDVDGAVAKPAASSTIDDLIKLYAARGAHLPACAASRPGRWWCRGSAFRWASCSSGSSRRRKRSTSSSRRWSIRSRCRAQRRPVLDWPYVEGLRLDEAMHPLTMLAVGLYGEVLPNQNGAPMRLVVPWKYGFKSIKSIVRIRLVEKQPTTAGACEPAEYGFYSNVNPDGGSSALDPGARAADRRVLQAARR